MVDYHKKANELYARNLELENQLIDFEKSLKVPLPQDVFDAFERFKRTGEKYQTKDELNIILMNVVFIGHYGDLAILKQYAMKNPTKYLKAVINGYTLEKENKLADEVSDMLQKWLDVPYHGSEAEDVRLFSIKLTEFFNQKLSKTS